MFRSHRPRALLALACVLAGTIALAGSIANAGSNAVVEVHLLAINDFHGNLEPPAGSGGRIGTTDAGGSEYLATHIKQDVAANPNSLVVAAGDLIGASPLLSALFHDEPTIEAMNALNLSVTSVGNHEFDEGATELMRMQKGGCHPTDGCKAGQFGGASFAYLSANVVKDPTKAQLDAVAKFNAKQRARVKAHKRFCAARANKRKATCRRAFRAPLRAKPKAAPLFPATIVRTVGGVKIGFIGETLKGTPLIVTPTGVEGLRFLDEATTANTYAKQLRAQGVNTVVLLIHQGGQQTPATDPNGCANFSGELTPIIDALSSDIDVVVSGHTHNFYNCTMNGKLVTSASSFGRLITNITLSIDNTTGRVQSKSAVNEVVTRTVPKDAAQTAILAKYQPLVAPLANRVIGSITENLTRSGPPSGETSLGDVIADAQLEATKAENKGGAMVAFMNPGGIRADFTASQISGGEQPGQVTYGEAFTVQPFANTLTVKTMTGDMIRRVLEQQFDNPGPGQLRILQVSSGFTYSYDATRPAGSRVDPASIKINGVVVVPTTSYRVTMNSFLDPGGDGFSVFKEGTNPLGGDVDVDALVAYFQAHNPVSPPALNRITRTG